MYPALNPSADFWMDVGDYAELRVYQNSGGALNVLQAPTYTPVFGCHYIQP